MATIKTKYLGNLRTEIEHVQSGQKIITDAPLDNHGKGEFISPTDIFTAAYTSCVFTIMGIAAGTHGFSVDGMSAETTKVMAENPRRVAKIQVSIKMPPNNYSEKERRIIEAVPRQCPVANSLQADIEKEVTFVW
ncbi:MAG: OsmC family protein [Prevotellaceae bacterium]|jgi:uncharacterized OsmC-like protein|nr:OsmC family protein [Prevotellaceae bacterium]